MKGALFRIWREALQEYQVYLEIRDTILYSGNSNHILIQWYLLLARSVILLVNMSKHI